MLFAAPSAARLARGFIAGMTLVIGCASDPAAPSLKGIKLVQDDSPGLALPKSSEAWLSRFNDGDSLFDDTFLDSQGLGPVFIRASCKACHASDGRGPGSVRKMAVVNDTGQPSDDQSSLLYGHTIRPQTIMGVTGAVEAPDDDSHLLVTVRMPPAVFGRGYLEAVRDDEIQRVEAEQAQRSDAISGRINWVTYASQPNSDTRFHDHQPGDTLIGRFGLKARVATLDDFTADAFQNDMGLTSDMRPDELPNPSGADDELPGIDLPIDDLNQVADYMRLLQLPTRSLPSEKQGAALFASAGCAACHVPSLHTQADYPIVQLADIDAPIFSDLLLHDMGSDFADGIDDYAAASSEWRTAPLIGLRYLPSYLHDGRAATIEQAIELHGGSDSEADAAASNFQQLDTTSRQQLLDYVSAL
jgi:CxxC motif-containing protein (DUF1111 family)